MQANEQQQCVIDTIDGVCLVLAGAGTGKTFVITNRISNMLKNNIASKNILAVTFTNKAAKEMKSRVIQLIGKTKAKDISISTFHAFAMKIIFKYCYKLNYTSNFALIDRADQLAIIIQALGTSDKKQAMMMLSLISLAKNEALSINDKEEIIEKYGQQVYEIYLFYQQYLQGMNVLDFDDLLLFSYQLMKNDSQILKSLQQQYQYVLVDEFQDTNVLQIKILDLLVGNKPNLCVVGDDDQSIYKWRGAKIENILSFPDKYPHCKVFYLTKNYRSSSAILQGANSLIANNKDRHKKSLQAYDKSTEKIKIIKCSSIEREANFVANKIYEMHHNGNQLYRNFAILYRSNYQSSILEDRLRYHKIPYRIIGDKSFYERREVKDVIAYFKLLLNEDDDMSLLRIIDAPPRNIGGKTMQKLRIFAKEKNLSLIKLMKDTTFIEQNFRNASSIANFIAIFSKFTQVLAEQSKLYDVLFAYLHEIGYLTGLSKMYKIATEKEIRYNNILELLEYIDFLQKEKKIATLQDYLNRVALAEEYSKQKQQENEEIGVNLMSVHAAKGLEFESVFLIGMEQNIFPHERSLDEGNLAEERRLCYVAITRAKKNLFISWSKERKINKIIRQQRKSQFLDELDEDCYEIVAAKNLIGYKNQDDVSNFLQAYLDKNS